MGATLIRMSATLTHAGATPTHAATHPGETPPTRFFALAVSFSSAAASEKKRDHCSLTLTVFAQAARENQVAAGNKLEPCRTSLPRGDRRPRRVETRSGRKSASPHSQ
jgi:hypothetical protein